MGAFGRGPVHWLTVDVRTVCGNLVGRASSDPRLVDCAACLDVGVALLDICDWPLLEDVPDVPRARG